MGPPLGVLAAEQISEAIAWDLRAALWAASALALSFLFATLRFALQHALPARVLATAHGELRRARLEPLLARTSTLATSAGILELSCELSFATLLLVFLSGDGDVSWTIVVRTLLVSVPCLLILAEAVPALVARRWGDRILARVLWPFSVLQLPLRVIVVALEGTRRALVRMLGVRETGGHARLIVEGLREVIEDSAISGGLDDTEREIIENVMEFRDVDVAAIMTPRTEIEGLEVGLDLAEAAREAADSGHGRLPVYDGSLDAILGTVGARDLLQALAQDVPPGRPAPTLRDILRPAYFVPETKRVSELLAEFRREKIKIAIVLDEYGGTAGIATLGDVLAEIVGDIQDEFDADAQQAVRRLGDGSIEVDAALHVSDANEELGLDIPDGEDYETLGGYVLAELGHLPRAGERFESGGVEYVVAEASDRRVLKVLVRRQPAQAAARA